MLDGKFCSEAWDAISRYVYTALQGGSIMKGWTNDEKMMIACCSDGTRPVIFKKANTYQFWDSLGISISYETFSHDAVYTMEECHSQEVEKNLGVPICKNLFLCNRPKLNYDK